MDEVTNFDIGEYVWFNPCANRPISFEVPAIHCFVYDPNLRSRYYKSDPVLELTTLLAV